jgi:putative hydrolase of the HAD superfamily
MPLKNIIFDLGGVIIDLDYNRTAAAFKQLGIVDFDDIYSKAKQTSLFDDFEKGWSSDADFRAELSQYLPPSTSDTEIDEAWNAMLLDIPKHRVDWLKKVAKRYRIFLLSNTNHIHVRSFTTYADHKFGTGAFEKIFEKYYFSCEMGMRKPDAEIFELVIQENNLDKSATLFIDDSIQHIHGAEKVGLKAEWLNIPEGEKIESKYDYLLS